MRLLALALALGCGSGPPLQWQRRADLPAARSDHALVALDGSLYALGGFSTDNTARVDRYDPLADAWTRVADMHEARRRFFAAALGGKIYVACGQRWTDPNSSQLVTITEEYDPATGAWTPRAPCPVKADAGQAWRESISGGAIGGKLYAVAYASATSAPGTSTWEYDPAADRWTQKAPPPAANGERWAAATDGARLFAIRSTDFFQPGADPTRSAVASYDPATDKWTARPPLDGIWSPAVVASGGIVFAFGGALVDYFGSAGATDSVNVLGATGWSGAGSLRVARQGTAAALLDGFLYVAGGSSAVDPFLSQPLASVEAAPLSKTSPTASGAATP